MYAFDTSNTDEPITVLRQAISNKKINLHDISPKDLEIIVGSVFRDFFHCNVKHIGGPNDGGIDLLLLEADAPVAIQVKRRKNAKASESVSVVRELLGSMIVKAIPRGIVVSTAAKFSKPAQNEASSSGVARSGMSIDLYSFDRIYDILKLTSPPDKPWASCISTNALHAS